MKILTYDDSKVTLLRATEYPGTVVQAALKLTMSKELHITARMVSQKTLQFVVDAGHTSVLEHITFTIALENVSRSFLAQITRHRMGSFTSASQHYADYRDMPMVVHPSYVDQFKSREHNDSTGEPSNEFEIALLGYEGLIDNSNIPPEEARQVLPNACAVNILWTVNARSLLNFFEQRLCKRNVAEMQIVARKVYDVIEDYWPEFAECCGPYCYPTGECNQGKLSCGEPYDK